MWGLLVTLPAALYAWSYSGKVLKGKGPEDAKNSLTKDEKLRVIISEIFSPIIAGAIYYYRWAKVLPKRANEANRWSFIAFIGVIIGVFALASLLDYLIP